MKNILRSVHLTLCIFLLNTNQAQVTNHTTNWQDDDLLVIFGASFPYGSLSTCPAFSSMIEYGEGEITITAIYHTSGIWPQFACGRIDTVLVPGLAPDICMLVINYARIIYDGTAYDTISFGDVDEVNICATAIADGRADPQISVHPNPFSDRLWMDLSSYSAAAIKITLLDIQGRTLAGPWQEKPMQHVGLELPGLAAGSYLLKLEADGNVHLLRIFRE